MKKIIFLSISAIALFAACTNYYQVFRVQPQQEMYADSHQLSYQNSNLQITYDFWGDEGNMSFKLLNNSTQTMHIYLDECFLIKNGYAMDFQQLDVKAGKEPFACGVVSIPPKTFRYFNCPKIQSETLEFLFCDGEMTPDRTEIRAKEFNQELSPLNFGVRMTYSLGQNTEKMMASNDFYVAEIINYHKVNFEQCHYDTLRICNEIELIPIQDVRSANKFLIEY